MVKSLGKSNIKSNDLSKRKRLDYEDSASDAEPESSFRGKLDDYEALRLPNSDEEEEDSEEGDAFEEDEYYSDVDSDMDGDAPRAVAWQDDEDPETLQEGSSDEDEDSEPGANSRIVRQILSMMRRIFRSTLTGPTARRCGNFPVLYQMPTDQCK